MSDAAWFRTEQRREVYRGFSSVRVDTVRMPDGTTADREVVARYEAVAVVPLTDDDQVLLLKHYRQPFERYLLEVPAGLMDQDDEDPQQTARRELAEELQHEAASFTKLTTFYNSAGWTDERTHVFLARGLAPVEVPEGFVAEGEEAAMEVIPMAFDDAVQIARDGGFPDAKTALGFLLAAAHLDR